MDHATADAQPVVADMTKWSRYGKGPPPAASFDTRAISKLQAEIEQLSRIVVSVRDAEQNRWIEMGKGQSVDQSIGDLSARMDARWHTINQTLTKLNGTLHDNTAALQEASGAKMECVVCLDKPRNTVILPCSHLAVCGDCFAQCRNCPVCRDPWAAQ